MSDQVQTRSQLVTALSDNIIGNITPQIVRNLLASISTTAELGTLATLSTVSDSNVSSGIDAAKIGNGSVSNAEFQTLDGVTSSIQTQLNGKVSSATFISGVNSLTTSISSATTTANGALQRIGGTMSGDIDFASSASITNLQNLTANDATIAGTQLSEFYSYVAANVANIAGAVSAAEAATDTASEALSTAENALPLSGGTMSGNLDIGGGDITSVNQLDVATIFSNSVDTIEFDTAVVFEGDVSLAGTTFDMGGGNLVSNGTILIGDIDENGGFTMSNGAIGVNQGGSTVLSAGELCTPYFGDANINTLIDASAGDGSMIILAATTFGSTIGVSEINDSGANEIFAMDGAGNLTIWGATTFQSLSTTSFINGVDFESGASCYGEFDMNGNPIDMGDGEIHNIGGNDGSWTSDGITTNGCNIDTNGGSMFCSSLTLSGGVIANLRPSQYATSSLPDATTNEGVIVYDHTTKTAKLSNGTTWLEL